MTLTEEFTHKYVAILRCRTWGEWPEWNRFFLPAYEEPLPLPDGRRLLLSIHIATYAKRDRPEATPAKPLEKTSPILWRGRMVIAYWQGKHYLQDPVDELTAVDRYYEAYKGEDDNHLHDRLADPASPTN